MSWYVGAQFWPHLLQRVTRTQESFRHSFGEMRHLSVGGWGGGRGVGLFSFNFLRNDTQY